MAADDESTARARIIARLRDIMQHADEKEAELQCAFDAVGPHMVGRIGVVVPGWQVEITLSRLP